MRMTVTSVLSHLVIRPRLFCKINENEIQKKINIDLAIVASQMSGGAIHDIIIITPSLLRPNNSGCNLRFKA